MSKQHPPAPTKSAVGPCPTIFRSSRTPRHWKITQNHRTTRPPPFGIEGGRLVLGSIAFRVCSDCFLLRPPTFILERIIVIFSKHSIDRVLFKSLSRSIYTCFMIKDGGQDVFKRKITDLKYLCHRSVNYSYSDKFWPFQTSKWRLNNL